MGAQSLKFRIFFIFHPILMQFFFFFELIGPEAFGSMFTGVFSLIYGSGDKLN